MVEMTAMSRQRGPSRKTTIWTTKNWLVIKAKLILECSGQRFICIAASLPTHFRCTHMPNFLQQHNYTGIEPVVVRILLMFSFEQMHLTCKIPQNRKKQNCCQPSSELPVNRCSINVFATAPVFGGSGGGGNQ